MKNQEPKGTKPKTNTNSLSNVWTGSVKESPAYKMIKKQDSIANVNLKKYSDKAKKTKIKAVAKAKAKKQ